MKLLPHTLLSALALLFFMCFSAQDVQAQDKAKSWTGEIVDLNCYLTKGAKGPDHASCAKSCIKGGQPMGLLTDDGTLVLLAPVGKAKDVYEGLKEKAGEKVSVTGTLAERDGMKMLAVSGEGK